MRSTDIEAWAHRVMDRVEGGQPNEDSRVELKREWIEPAKMARRLAGHANAARTEPILWLIGIDEGSKTVVGVEEQDTAKWYPAIAACFQEVPPRVTDILVHRADKTVVALLFETDRPPYLVRNPSFGEQRGVNIEYEVPWREGTAIRTARREDLFRILIPQVQIPRAEVRRVSLTRPQQNSAAGPPMCRCLIYLYFVKVGEERAYIPFHDCAARIRTPEMQWVHLDGIHFEMDQGDRQWLMREPRVSYSVAISETEMAVDGAGAVVMIGFLPVLRARETGAELEPTINFDAPIEIDLSLRVAGAETRLRISTDLNPITRPNHEAARWGAPTKVPFDD